MMKTPIKSIFYIAFLLLGINSCQSPEDFQPNVERNGINNLTASFFDDDNDENSFSSEIDYQNKIITVVFPYNYPRLSDHVLEKSALKRMRVIANLDNNVSISPKLFSMDLTKENIITVTDAIGIKTDYKVVAEIRKSKECSISKFDLKESGLTGIVKEADKTISLVTLEKLGNQLADVTISHGATLSPDPTITPLNYDNDVKIKVIAQDGITSSVYTVKKEIPEKLATGLRANSAKLLWVKKIVDLGITSKHMVTGIAAIDNYLFLNERANPNALYLDANTGNIAGKINISKIAGSLTNFYATADKGNNILICNLCSGKDTKFIVWRIKGVNGTPEKYIEYSSSLAIGRKFSVIGSLDKDAIITAPYMATAGQFALWQVKEGKLVSQTPTTITAKGLGSWGNNADVIFTDPTNTKSDYLAAFYTTPRNLSWFDGTSNSIKAKGPEISANWIQNAVDYVVFNKTSYALSNSVNSFTWGVDDSIYMFDMSDGSLKNQPVDFGEKGLNINGNYGGKAAGEQNTNGTGDVALRVSPDGYYLYIYFMFTNGYVGCVRCDCLDI